MTEPAIDEGDLGGALVVAPPKVNLMLEAMRGRLGRVSHEIESAARDLNSEADLDAICARLTKSAIEVADVVAFIRGGGHHGKARWGKP